MRNRQLFDDQFLREGGWEFETLTPNISPKGARGPPKFLPLVWPEGPYLSFKCVIPKFTGRGMGYRHTKF